jgi:hypothetical protein
MRVRAMTRRTLLIGASSLAPVPASAAGIGAAMLEDVRTYDAMGEHRTGAPADDATSAWLRGRLGEAGLVADLQPFDIPLFVPRRCELRVGRAIVATFPAWPVAQTPAEGLAAPLAPSDAPSLEGRIAVVKLPRAGGVWAAPGMGEAVLATCRRGPRAVVAVTGGPTGGVVAMNAAPALFDWPVPVVIAAGQDGERLSSLAAGGAPAILVCAGDSFPRAMATNVVARRPGRGRTIVVSTPKSGWFHCAGERGTGLAVFIDLAAWLARHSDADLQFVAFAGHELDYRGGERFLRSGAPAPAGVRIWLHVGANAAMQTLSVLAGAARPDPAGAPGRRVTASAAALEAARQVFGADAGYAPPLEMNETNALGELSIIRRIGYPALAGIIGANPLFHTRLDRADVATNPAELDRVARAARAFLWRFATAS